MEKLKWLTNEIIEGHEIEKDEAIELLEYSISDLSCMAKEIREHFCGNSFDMCTIINGKSGKCEEDCKYCAQSSSYNTDIDIFPLLSKDVVFDDALNNFSKGINRYSIVTSGKAANDSELEKLCDIYKGIKDKMGIKLCASHGLLNYHQFLKLKEVGVTRYHNNLETSEKFFPNICSTHTFSEKVEAILNAQKAGLEVCSGGIIGLGEGNEDRIDLAFSLKDLKITSIPLNLLNPIKGTPLEDIDKVSEEQFYKIAAIFRFINPAAVIRLAGGRNLLKDYGLDAFKAGVNGTISGELLTTYGCNTENDIKMIEGVGYEITN